MVLHRNYVILFFAFLFINAQPLSAQVCHSSDLLSISEIHPYKSLAADSIGLAPTGNYDLIYHRISVKVDPAVRYIEGIVTSYFRPDTSLSQIAFDLTDTLTVDSVYYRGASISSFAHTGNAILISFATTISSFDSVTIYYHGVPPATGFGSFEVGTHDSIPALWTLSEPYGSRDWFPGKMTLTDKADSLDFYINVPVGNRAASNGLLIDSMLLGNTVTYHWKTRYPIANYLIAMAVTNYSVYADTVPTDYGNIYMLNYVYQEDLVYWHDNDSTVASALQMYSRFFGPYPFIKEKYGHAQFGWGGGMEHQTMSFLYNWNYELINHEMAHQWFGDKLTCGSWADIWLNEGFAVYLSGLCYEYLSPTYWLPWRQNTLSTIVNRGQTGSVYCTDTNEVSRIFSNTLSYYKGARVLHMIRWELGDSLFFAGLRSYIGDTSFAYGFSATALLQKHFEQASGRDLSGFFNQWIYGSGYPVYALDWAYRDGKLSCRLSQSTTDPSVNFYTMDVPVRFYGSGGDTTIVLRHLFSGQEYAFELSFSVDSVQIDPELWLISGANVTRRLPALDQADFLQIYPNPVSDNMTIWYDSRNITEMRYDIYDMQGQKVKSGSTSGQNDYYTTSLQGLPCGIYMIRVNANGSSLSQRLVKGF